MKGVCKICGCTMKNPCFSHKYGFCWWPTFEEDICSHCANPEIKDDPNVIHCVHGMEFPVLSVHQPYAQMLVEGKKPYEFRGWKLPERYVGQRIFIHATKTLETTYDEVFACGNKDAFDECWKKAFNYNLHTMIIGSVVFGKTIEPLIDVVNFDGQPVKVYRWPVQDPVKLDYPLESIPGKQGIWKISF